MQPNKFFFSCVLRYSNPFSQNAVNMPVPYVDQIDYEMRTINYTVDMGKKT